MLLWKFGIISTAPGLLQVGTLGVGTGAGCDPWHRTDYGDRNHRRDRQRSGLS